VIKLAAAPAIGIFLAVLLATTAWAEPPEGITINLQVGYGGYVQLGRINMVVVEMENQSASTNLSGELILDHEGVEYTTRLELPTPSKKRFYMYFPCGSFPPVLVLRVRTKAYTESFEIPTYRFTQQPANACILVLSRQSGSLGVLNKIPGVRLQRNLHGSDTAMMSTSESYVSYVDIDQVDANPKYFACADVIVLADIDYQQVTPELAEALKASVSGGKSLIFSLGLNGAGVAGSPLAGLCPLQPTGTVQTSDLGDFGRRYGIRTGDAPATLAVGTLAPGAEVAAWAGMTPAIVRMLRGSGRISALAFSFTAVPFKQNPGLQPLFIDSALRIEDSVQVTDWFIHPQFVGDILEGLAEAKPMAPGFVLLFLLSYVVLIGPANFIILGKLKRRTLVWTTIPVIILGFSFVGLYTGYFYRGADNVTAYFQELHIFPGSDYVPYQTTMLVFTAERTTYELTVPDEAAFLYPDVPSVQSGFSFGASGAGMRGLSGSKIDNSNQPTIHTTSGKWTPKTYFYQGYMGMGASAESTLSGVHAAAKVANVSGSFTLNLPFDLYACELHSPTGDITRLGDLSGRGTYQSSGMQTNITGSLNLDNYLVVERNKLQSQFKRTAQPGLDYRREFLLTGYTEEVPVLAEFKKPHVQHSLSMVVVHLPYEAIIPRTGAVEVARTRLVGGAGFAVYDPNEGYGYYGAPRIESYDMPKDSYVDIACELAGGVGSGNHLHLSLSGWYDNEQLLYDFSPFLGVTIWDSGSWRPVMLLQNSPSIDIPIGGALDNDRQVTVRLTAIEELALTRPEAMIF
jgi:hypothetical protein